MDVSADSALDSADADIGDSGPGSMDALDVSPAEAVALAFIGETTECTGAGFDTQVFSFGPEEGVLPPGATVCVTIGFEAACPGDFECEAQAVFSLADGTPAGIAWLRA